MTHYAVLLDDARIVDESLIMQSILRGVQLSGVEVTVIVPGKAEDQPTPFFEEVHTISAPIPPRPWRRRAEANRLADILENLGVDAIFWSGLNATGLAHDLAAELDLPLVGDLWREEQILEASRSSHVDTWIARTEALAEQIRTTIRHGTIISARPPIESESSSHMPDTRPSLVVLDPGPTQASRYMIIDALQMTMDLREDLEVFLELRGRRAHRVWRMLQNDPALSQVTALDTLGPVRELVSAATIVAAPDPACPARTIVPAAMCGGAAIICADTRNDELLREDETAVVPMESTPESWRDAMVRLLDDPPLRQRIARAGKVQATRACRPSAAIDAWVTGLSLSVDPPAYPLG